MIVITGGAFQGKSAYAKNLNQGNTQIIEDVHLLVADWMRAGADPYSEIEELMNVYPEGIFVVNELGCGIVPVEQFDRDWRELTGRVSCILAERAEAVYRITCGIATRIK